MPVVIVVVDYVADMQMEELLVKRKKMVSCSTPWLVMSTQKLFKKLTRLHVCLKILLLMQFGNSSQIKLKAPERTCGYSALTHVCQPITYLHPVSCVCCVGGGGILTCNLASVHKNYQMLCSPFLSMTCCDVLLAV